MFTHAVNSNEAIVLWGVGLSPYVRKVQIALAEKNLAYEHQQILPAALLTATQQAIPEAFAKASPLGKIPALQIGNHCVADSAVICHFLDKKYPVAMKLYPEAPEAYARTLWFENYADNIFSSVAYKKIFLEAVVKPAVFGSAVDHESIEQAKTQELPSYLDYLDKEVNKHAWLAGDHFSMADVAVITHFISLEQAGFYLAGSPWKNLARYKEKVMERESIKKVIA